ncbi:hypothetical protein QL285_062127 [Trifolium repens]|nr:hypothetical protein QL285_062127 [Trifolium repens]
MGVSNRQIWFLVYVAVGCSRSASFVTFWFWCDERRHSLPPPSRSAPELLSLGLVVRIGVVALSVSICWFGFNLGCGLVGGYGSANTSFVLLLVLYSVVVVFSFFLALLVCVFGFWFPGLLRFAGIKSFNFASAALEKLGRLTTLARNGLVLVAAVASCRLLSLFPC